MAVVAVIGLIGCKEGSSSAGASEIPDVAPGLVPVAVTVEVKQLNGLLNKLGEICALIARTESMRKHAMHAAVAVGLIGALASLGRAMPAVMAGDVSRPAVMSQLVMGALLLVYVYLGVQSFIAARKARGGR